MHFEKHNAFTITTIVLLAINSLFSFDRFLIAAPAIIDLSTKFWFFGVCQVTSFLLLLASTTCCLLVVRKNLFALKSSIVIYFTQIAGFEIGGIIFSLDFLPGFIATWRSDLVYLNINWWALFIVILIWISIYRVRLVNKKVVRDFGAVASPPHP